MEKQTTIFGIRPVIEAIKSGKNLDKVLIQKGLQGELIGELNTLLSQANIPIQYVPYQKLNRITSKNHQGVIASLSFLDYAELETVLPGIYEQGKVPNILVLDRITDVRNFGALSRSAECAGVDAIVIPDKGFAQINAESIKTSAGALHKIPVCKSKSLSSTIDYLKNSGLQIVSCTEKTNKDIYSVDFSLPTAIIIGSEEDGIAPHLIAKSDAAVKIPMYGSIESLNASVAASIIVFEVARQRYYKNL